MIELDRSRLSGNGRSAMQVFRLRLLAGIGLLICVGSLHCQETSCHPADLSCSPSAPLLYLPPLYSIRGTVAGLSANGLTLQNNGGDDLTLNAGAASFTFAGRLPAGANYDVTRFFNANNLNCAVSNGSGIMRNRDVTSVAVVCTPVDYSALFSNASAGLTAVRFSSSAFADVDGDGDLDLVVTGQDSLSVPTANLYTNDGAGGFANAGAGLAGARNGSVSFADVDGDGDQDLLVTGDIGGPAQSATLYRNDGSGGFANAGAALTAVAFSSSAFADVDRDGDQDLAIAGFDGAIRTTTLYTNNGAGVFNDAGASLFGADSGQIVFADATGNGAPDLLVTGNPGVAILYANNGAGGFTDAGAALTGVGESSISSGDIDGDGDLDLLLTGNAAGQITRLYRNNGAGGFTDTGAGLVGVDVGYSAFADVDRDGDLDLLITGADGVSNQAILYTNDGTGAFTQQAAGFTGVSGRSVSFADVDRDGDLDLVLTGTGASFAPTATLYRNNLD